MMPEKQTPAGISGGQNDSEIHDVTSDTYDSTEAALRQLNPEHLAMLREESGICDELIAARGYRTITDRKELNKLGFSRAQSRVPGLLLPLHTTDGGNTLSVYRPDNPRVAEQKNKGKLPDGTYPNKVIKYEVPKGTGTRIDCPPTCQPMLADPSIPLWITEGQKKADSLVSHGLCAIALLGVWNWKGKNPFGGTTFSNDFDYIALDGRDVRLVFDSDAMTNPNVRNALERFTEHLQRKKAHIIAVCLPPDPNGNKVGVDDWLAAGHTVEELEALVGGPRPQPQPAPPIVELLDAPPPAMRRPLTLVDERAYAAVWLPVRVTRTEGLDRKGNIIQYNPPEVEEEIRLFVIRDDGTIFGDDGDKPMADLGLEVVLPEMPRPSRTWSSPGVKAYRSGRRPNPVDVFKRIAAIADRYIDFARSLADQPTMAELVACYSLTTWFLDAFNVIGYLWPNGSKGSGKTVLLHVVAETAYLGQVILAGGSYATLRDLADYGATLAFDDAENLSDPKLTDPDKRALLLAGNRRGSTVTVKEPGPNRTWRTRHVDAFCPRLFSAIKLPDDVLASRSIVIPLIRTPDSHRADVDPLDYDTWPHDRRQLIDDLWALALAYLPELRTYYRTISERASLTGRNLEPWRAILAVALWLDEKDPEGCLRRTTEEQADDGNKRVLNTTLFERMNSLSVAYQTERADLDYGDFPSLVIRALCANCANPANRANYSERGVFLVTAADISNEARSLAADDETTIDIERINAQRVGMQLRKMRLKKRPRPGGVGPRRWEVTLGDLQHWTSVYGMSLPDVLRDMLGISPQVGTVGIVGPVGTDQDDSDLWEGTL
jgi:hypothetical protein